MHSLVLWLRDRATSIDLTEGRWVDEVYDT